MKQAFPAFMSLLLATTFCVAQESTTTTEIRDTATGFEWLKQFEGTWETTSKSPDDQHATTNKGMMKSRSLGKLWIVNEYSGQVGSMNCQVVQTIGYDSEEKQFNSSWIDSVMNHRWHSTGSLDESGKLTLEAKGPDWTDPKQSKRYRNIYEFKSENEITSISQTMNKQGQWETFMTGKMTKQTQPDNQNERQTTVTPFLMFDGQAEAAINFYKTVFPDTQVESMIKYEAGEGGKEGTIKTAVVAIAGQRIMCIDSPTKTDFDFTPSFSFFVECENENQLKERFDKLAKGGKVMMPIGNYGFSEQFGWTSDEFGVNWQLNLK